MARYLLLLLVVVALVWVLRSERRAALRRRMPPSAKAAAKSETLVGGEDIVGCAYCDLHLPLSEAVRGQPSPEAATPDAEARTGAYYCCEAHRIIGDLATSRADRGAR